MAHDQRVILIEELGAPGKLDQKELLKLFVGDLWADKPKAREDALRISVYDEDRPVRSVEQDRVCCLWTDAPDREQLGSQSLCGLGEHRAHIAAVMTIQMLDERFEFPRFLAEVPSGEDQLRELFFGELRESLRREGVVLFEIPYGALDVLPIRRLG